MTLYVYPVLYVLLLWWFSTGLILYLNGLPRWTHKWTLIGASFFLFLGALCLYASRDDVRITGAYLGFTGALLVWAWQEVAFLLGTVTGSRRLPLPAGARGWRRALYAWRTVWHHEMALLVLGVLVYALTQGGDNLTGWWSFCVLYVMRQSAKLNLFLGVRNLAESFLPPHLTYLQTYFRRRNMNPLMPWSLLLGGLAAAGLWHLALQQPLEPIDASSRVFVAMLLTLAVLEHAFMVMPMPSDGLWAWGLRSREAAGREEGR
jgi:putative photosynthetic complex assembly protein 2